MTIVDLGNGIARWYCTTCGKSGPPMQARHAREAGRWHAFRHDPIRRNAR